MLEVLALVTFLHANGTKSVVPVYPPGGDYHKAFEAICEQNKPQVANQLRTMYEQHKISMPVGAEKIDSIRIMCVPSTKT